MPWPEYNEVVSTFFDLVREQGCWLDYDYDPVETAKLFANETTVKHATIPEIRRMLTYIVRGERFCDGFWEGMIEEGHVRRLLERLAEIEREGRRHDGSAVISRRMSAVAGTPIAEAEPVPGKGSAWTCRPRQPIDSHPPAEFSASSFRNTSSSKIAASHP